MPYAYVAECIVPAIAIYRVSARTNERTFGRSGIGCNWVVDGDDNRQQQKLYTESSLSLFISLSHVAEVWVHAISLVFVVVAIYRCFCCCYYWIIIISILYFRSTCSIALSISPCLFYSCVLFNAEETQQWHRRAPRSQINTKNCTKEHQIKKKKKKTFILAQPNDARYNMNMNECISDLIRCFWCEAIRSKMTNEESNLNALLGAVVVSFDGRAIVCSSLTWYYTLEKSLDSNLSAFGLCVRAFFPSFLFFFAFIVRIVLAYSSPSPLSLLMSFCHLEHTHFITRRGTHQLAPFWRAHPRYLARLPVYHQHTKGKRL